MDCEPTCGACGEPASKLRCGRCKIVAYCTANCQRKHWKTHKEGCRPAPKPAKPPVVNACPLATTANGFLGHPELPTEAERLIKRFRATETWTPEEASIFQLLQEKIEAGIDTQPGVAGYFLHFFEGGGQKSRYPFLLLSCLIHLLPRILRENGYIYEENMTSSGNLPRLWGIARAVMTSARIQAFMDTSEDILQNLSAGVKISVNDSEDPQHFVRQVWHAHEAFAEPGTDPMRQSLLISFFSQTANPWILSSRSLLVDSFSSAVEPLTRKVDEALVEVLRQKAMTEDKARAKQDQL